MATIISATALDRYRASLKRVEILDAEAERELAQRWAEGDEHAGAQLIESSLPFVIAIAREYRRWGVPLEDLVQQGNLGLLKAASKFDPDKNCRLIKGQVFLWKENQSWEDLWDLNGEVTPP